MHIAWRERNKDARIKAAKEILEKNPEFVYFSSFIVYESILVVFIPVRLLHVSRTLWRHINKLCCSAYIDVVYIALYVMRVSVCLVTRVFPALNTNILT